MEDFAINLEDWLSLFIVLGLIVGFLSLGMLSFSAYRKIKGDQ